MLNVQVVFVGRRYDAAQSLPDRLCLPDGATVDDALKAISAQLSGDNPLSASCLVAVSAVHLGTLADHRPRMLKDGDELLLLAPVAGG
ncbi:MAG: MoaD/ThiS family protein [Thermoguttaceae bacterium]